MDLIVEMKRTIAVWTMAYWAWIVIYYVLGIAGALLAIVVARIPDYKIFGGSTPLAVLSACCVALLGFLKPAQVAAGFDQAYSGLYSATLRYEQCQRSTECGKAATDFTAARLIAEYERLRNIVRESNFRTPADARQEAGEQP